MTSRDFRERLLRRSQKAGVNVSDATIEPLESYFRLLAKWNAKINLTALSLERPTSETFDRLFVEPLAAASNVPLGPMIWFDLGSGGGSPALPLKIVRPAASLTMVEAKARKAAFLREATRTLVLSGALVENARFEGVAQARRGTAQLVTVRAVKLDRALVSAASQLLESEGRLFLFGPDPRALLIAGFAHQDTVELVPERRSFLSIYRRVFHVERHEGRTLAPQ